MLRFPFLNGSDDFVRRHIAPLRPPRRIRRIAKPAPQVTPTRAHKHARQAREKTLTLHRTINLSDSHCELLFTTECTEDTERESQCKKQDYKCNTSNTESASPFCVLH